MLSTSTHLSVLCNKIITLSTWSAHFKGTNSPQNESVSRPLTHMLMESPAKFQVQKTLKFSLEQLQK